MRMARYAALRRCARAPFTQFSFMRDRYVLSCVWYAAVCARRLYGSVCARMLRQHGMDDPDVCAPRDEIADSWICACMRALPESVDHARAPPRDGYVVMRAVYAVPVPDSTEYRPDICCAHAIRLSDRIDFARTRRACVVGYRIDQMRRARSDGCWRACGQCARARLPLADRLRIGGSCA